MDVIKYLPRCLMIAVLISNQIHIFTSTDLKSVQQLNKKAHTFCLNNAVYKGSQTSSGGAVTTDQICVATLEKPLHFYEFTNIGGSYRFEEVKNKNDRGPLLCQTTPIQLCK